MIEVRIENTYEDGHESTHIVHLPAPEGDLDSWWEDVVLEQTGDGHGIDNDLGYCYEATVVGTPKDFEHLLGESREWSGS